MAYRNFVDFREQPAGGTADLTQPQGDVDIRTDGYGRPWTVFVQPAAFPTAVVACMWANGKGVPDERIEVLRDGQVWYYHRDPAPDAVWYMQLGTVADALARKVAGELKLQEAP